MSDHCAPAEPRGSSGQNTLSFFAAGQLFPQPSTAHVFLCGPNGAAAHDVAGISREDTAHGETPLPRTPVLAAGTCKGPADSTSPWTSPCCISCHACLVLFFTEKGRCGWILDRKSGAGERNMDQSEERVG